MILRNTVLDSSYSQVSQTMLGFFGALRETHFSFKSGVPPHPSPEGQITQMLEIFLEWSFSIFYHFNIIETEYLYDVN